MLVNRLYHFRGSRFCHVRASAQCALVLEAMHYIMSTPCYLFPLIASR